VAAAQIAGPSAPARQWPRRPSHRLGFGWSRLIILVAVPQGTALNACEFRVNALDQTGHV